MFKENLKKKTDTRTITGKQNGLLQFGVRKCSHLPQWFGKRPKWKRLQAFFGLLPPQYGKCYNLPLNPRIYPFSGFYSNIYSGFSLLTEVQTYQQQLRST
jgi:hypothetical protein